MTFLPFPRGLARASFVLLACALAPALAQQQGGAATKFDPVKHGFNFVNFFAGDVLIDVPGIGRVDVGDTTYGLCGGMSYAAADTYVAQGTAPDYAIPASGSPAELQPGQPVRSWLYDRQLDTMKADNAFLVRRLIAWTWRPIATKWGVTGLHVLSDREFKRKISDRIDAGRVVPLCLIKADVDDYLPSSDALTPAGFTKNHQVLAIGYRLVDKTNAMGRHWAIDVYDPNYPDEVHTLHYHEDKRVQTRRSVAGVLVANPDDVQAHRVGGFRGFFVTPYSAKLPPWVQADVGRLGALSRVEGLLIDERPEDGFDERGARIEDLKAERRAAAKGGKAGTKQGTGLDGVDQPDVKAAEGDTAIATRGKPAKGYRTAAGPAGYVRLGRVVVPFAPDAAAESTRVEVVDPTNGEVLAGEYGKAEFDLLPGTYTVRISGKDVPDVEVQAAKDSVIECGVLRATLGQGQKVEVLDADQKTVLASGYGKLDAGLPAGTYHVRVQKRSEPVTIEDGKVTAF